MTSIIIIWHEKFIWMEYILPPSSRSPKILVPRLHQMETLNVRENQSNCIPYVISFLEYWCFYVTALLCFQMIMPGENGCSSPRTTTRILLYRSNAEGTFLQLLLMVRWLKTFDKSNWKPNMAYFQTIPTFAYLLSLIYIYRVISRNFPSQLSY